MLLVLYCRMLGSCCCSNPIRNDTFVVLVVMYFGSLIVKTLNLVVVVVLIGCIFGDILSQ